MSTIDDPKDSDISFPDTSVFTEAILRVKCFKDSMDIFLADMG